MGAELRDAEQHRRPVDIQHIRRGLDDGDRPGRVVFAAQVVDPRELRPTLVDKKGEQPSFTHDVCDRVRYQLIHPP